MTQQPVPPMGTVDLTVQGSTLFSGSFIPPKVRINGHPVSGSYGNFAVPVPAGPVRVEAEAQWMRTFGQARLDFTLAPGQTVPVFYAPPIHQFTTGSMGHERQPTKGLGLFIGVLAAVVAIPVVFGIVMMLTIS